jgi:hypothetical protein
MMSSAVSYVKGVVTVSDTRIADNAQLVWMAMREQGKPVQVKNGLPVVVECTMREIINRLFPDKFAVGNSPKSAVRFHTEISLYLKYSGMAKLVKRPHPTDQDGGIQPGHWELAGTWADAGDEEVLARASQAYQRKDARASNPVRAVMAHVDSGTQLTTTGKAPLVTASPAPRPPVPETPSGSPQEALLAILAENDTMRSRLKVLEEQTIPQIQRELLHLTRQRDALRKVLADDSEDDT